MLRHINDDKVAIQSARNNRFLTSSRTATASLTRCVLASRVHHGDGLGLLESYFTGNVLQCDDKHIVKCENKNRLDWEAWRIVEPRTSTAAASQVQSVSDQYHALVGRDRQHLILDLAKGGKTPDEIEQIVTRLFDSPSLAIPSSVYGIPLDKKYP